MPKIFLIRGAFANQFELQNYEPLIPKFDLTVISSYKPITQTKLPTIKLWSPADLPNFPYKKAILNRLIGDQHWLLNLEDHISNADIVHVAETYYAYTHQAIRLKKEGEIKTLISTCWETIPHNNETLKTKRDWKRQAYQYIDHFITPTAKAKQALIAEGVSPRKISLVRVGVDLDRFSPKPKFNAKSHKPVVTFIGRHVPEKGVGDLKQIASMFRNIEVNFVDSVSYSQIHRIYQNTDIFVLPSHKTKTWEEQYGMVLVEAMASGLPIITTNTGAISEVVGDAAIIIKPHDPILLGQTIKNLISDQNLRQQLSRRARQRALKYFDRQLIAKQLANLYNRFI